MNQPGGPTPWSENPAGAATPGGGSSTYRAGLAWLYGLQRFGIKLGLENMERLMRELRIDLSGARVIHVAGTNGKGSVCAMMESIARAAGKRTGLFTSPHLVTYRERIRVDGEMISEEKVAEGLEQLRGLVANWEEHPTFFEITTALALRHFNEAKLDVVILETGLGGRLDATNAVPSNVAVITPIDFDHQKWLGETIPEIASEKAGIIKSNAPVVCASQVASAEKVIHARAREFEAPIDIIGYRYEDTPIALPGAHQKQNAAIALAGLRAAGIKPEVLHVARGLLAVEWPARFQRWDQQTFIDGAHNPAGARMLAETWRESFGGQKTCLVLAVLEDKDATAMCQALTPIAEFIILPRIRSERATDPQHLVRTILNLGVPCQIVPNVPDAMARAAKRTLPILITGSLHFAGEVLAFLQGRPAAFEECAQ